MAQHPLLGCSLTVEDHPIRRLRTADTLLCRGGQGVARDFIRIAGHGPWYHAAKFFYLDGAPYVVEMVEGHGGRELPWDEWLGECDGQVDVFRPNHRAYRRFGAVDWMRRNVVRQPYGTEVIRRFARQESWITCWWNRPCYDEKAPPPTIWVCSTAVACGDCYGGGVNPIFGLWPGDAQPSFLARCNLNGYEFTVDGGRRQRPEAIL